LKYNINEIFEGKQFAIIGNFPYNISTQIVFRTLEYRDQIPEFAGIKRSSSRFAKKGTKAYGILSVLVQAFMMQVFVYRRRTCFYSAR
jgi:16S rRNA (adenine1518-N6/adenine1519-N6)-dimethyltransferase